jgi:hypothetical protein
MVARRELDERSTKDENKIDGIDYVYFERGKLDQVNMLLRDQFWQTIDVHENLAWPGISKLSNSIRFYYCSNV